MPVEAKHIHRSIPFALLVLACVLFWLQTRVVPPPPAVTVAEKAEYAGSRSCEPCHPGPYADWKTSHHALAERELDPRVEGRAYRAEGETGRKVRHGDYETEFRERKGHFELVTPGTDGEHQAVEAVRAIGFEPLWQNVVAAPRGRYQVTALAYDPAADEWFDAARRENWRPEEWGFWAGRGMTWNSMCAACHTTAFEKRWDASNDAYDSAYVELGVGCESCHGPSLAHVLEMEAAGRIGAARIELSARWSHEPFRARLRDDSGTARGSAAVEPALPASDFADTPVPAGDESDSSIGASRPPRVDPGRILDLCGSCHARRAELTGRFLPGEDFLDHYRLDIPDATGTFHPDGQVHEEDYEYASFLSSRMYLVGVRCLHCHEPHSAKTRLDGNALCLSCHEGKIDPASHSHHRPDTPGGRCVDCHMPITIYMERDPRHDHGFTIPDPVLTREHGIPNACNRCHEDKDAVWSVRWVESWYGARPDRPSRRRARAIARGRKAEPLAIDALIEISGSDPSDLWRAAATGLLTPWLDVASVVERVIEAARDSSALVRAHAIRAMGPAVNSEALPSSVTRRMVAAMLPGLDDSTRLVRLEAAWALRLMPAVDVIGDAKGRPSAYWVDGSIRAGAELEEYLALSSDQPAGLVQRGSLELDRGRPAAAIPYLRQAAEWNPTDPGTRRALAIALSAAGDSAGALGEMERARALAPADATIALGLGLAYAEAGREEESEALLELACRLDPQSPRAWYNLAQIRWKRNRLDAALEAIVTAIEIDPEDPDALGTRSAIHRALGQESLADDYSERAERAREAWLSRRER
jgi:predicted CXXCH cytochrome family protein